LSPSPPSIVIFSPSISLSLDTQLSAIQDISGVTFINSTTTSSTLNCSSTISQVSFFYLQYTTAPIHSERKGMAFYFLTELGGAIDTSSAATLSGKHIKL
jgi:hypothetical protein